MDKNAIKKYAIWARNELIARVTQKAQQYGITAEEIIDANSDSVNGKLLSDVEKKQRQALIKKINAESFEQVMEEVSYTWFNRFTALRFMEVNNYLPSRTRVFTNDENEFKPQILSESLTIDIEGLDREKIFQLKEENKEDELYKYLLIVQCNALSSILPGMFQKIADYSELLLPDYLLREDSVIDRMLKDISEEDWNDQVQIIGWLYQYYNSEPKEKVFANLKNNIKVAKENVPAATQLFTPDWIVRYMVENSLGKIWVDGHPECELIHQWRYFISDAEQNSDCNRALELEIQSKKLMRPEDIKCIDPCSGSGHVLCYMFDVLINIYESYGYSSKEAVEQIVTSNIWGLDIDDRAAQLAYFSVMMKARQYDRRFFTRGIQPNVFAISESNSISEEIITHVANGNASLKADLETIINEMHDAKEYGSLIISSEINWEGIYNRLDEMAQNPDIFYFQIEAELLPVIRVAEILSKKYHAVITNPPYMGSSNMNVKLSDFVKKNYDLFKSDLFACFIDRGNKMILPGGYNSMVTMQSWMSLSSFEKMRNKILDNHRICRLMQMDNMVMGIAFGTTVTVLGYKAINGYKGTYHHIGLEDIENDIPKEFPIIDEQYAEISTDKFAIIPGSPIAYWVSEQLLTDFEKGKSLSEYALARNGMKTGDNGRFLRLWWEVNASKIATNIRDYSEAASATEKWFPYNKGGDFRKWYGNNEYIVDWENCGFRIFKNAKADKRNVQDYPNELKFVPSLSWSLITSGRPAFRYKEFNLSDIAGMSVFASRSMILKYLGLLNSPVSLETLKLITPTINYQAGDIARIPVLEEINSNTEIESLVEECIRLEKEDWDSFETSWDFTRSPLAKHGCLLEDAFEEWKKECEGRFNRVKEIEERINQICIDIYGLSESLTAEVEDKYISIHKADAAQDIKDFISYAVGCMFGRYSLDNDGLKCAGDNLESAYYTTFIPDTDNIIPICQDEYFQDDIASKFTEFLSVLFGNENLEENLTFIANALGGTGTPREVIRSYFLNDFYLDHVKKYQKTPIYWLFESGKSNGIKCLVYMHRYHSDTIARIRTDYVHEQQSKYRTEIADIEQRLASVSSSDRIKCNKRLKTLHDQEAELRIFEEKIHHLADQMISIDLDDGVKKNYAKFQDVLAKIK